MLTALILICSMATTPDIRDCSRTNAIDVMYTPVESANPATCFMHGQAYLASTDIGRNLTNDEEVKVVCARKQTANNAGTALAQSPAPAVH
jgi:hypothetical protein